jgi:CBS domain-containing protein
MTTKVVTVSPGNSIRHAAQMMLDHHVSGLPVVDDEGRLVGIVTEGDLLRRAELGLQGIAASMPAEDYIRSHGWDVGDVMTANVTAVDPSVAIDRVAAIMAEKRVKRLPVVDDGKLVGIVSRADLLRFIAVARSGSTIKGDDAIRRSVLARLGDVEELRSLRLGVIVTNGIIHLWGDVDSEPARRAACLVAEGISGAGGVVDHLAVIEQRGK